MKHHSNAPERRIYPKEPCTPPSLSISTTAIFAGSARSCTHRQLNAYPPEKNEGEHAPFPPPSPPSCKKNRGSRKVARDLRIVVHKALPLDCVCEPLLVVGRRGAPDAQLADVCARVGDWARRARRRVRAPARRWCRARGAQHYLMENY
jgi:hypothetical protein